MSDAHESRDPDATIEAIAARFAAVAEIDFARQPPRREIEDFVRDLLLGERQLLSVCATGLTTTREFALGLTDRVYVWLAHRAGRSLTAPFAVQWNAAIDEIEVIAQTAIDH